MGVSFGKTYSIGNNHNSLWRIGANRGKPFEDNIYKYLKILCRGKRNVQINQTPSVNDGGKDVIIRFSGNSLTLFGITFNSHGKEETTIYIECKSTDQSKLRREKFYPSVDNVIHADSKIDFFVLLTNSVILAKDHYHVKKDLERIGADFVLIDQYILARQLTLTPYDKINAFPYFNGNDHFYLEYQVYHSDSVEESLEIYFVFRNYSSDKKEYTLSLLTNLNWITENNEYQITIDPYDSFAHRILLRCENKSDYQDIDFVVSEGNENYHIVITKPCLSAKYIPIFIGEQHNRVVNEIFSSLDKDKLDNLFCLWGDAGVGKTRIIAELENRINNNSLFDIYNCTLKTNNTSTIKDIYSFLRKYEYLKQDVANDIDNFKDTILSCSYTVNYALIIIDDFHNSSKQFIDQIKELKNHSAPVILVLCGRTDYSAGNTDYYNFVEWSYNNLKKGNTIWDIKPLKPEDTKNFIRCSIQNVPDEVYDSIFRNSQNNPLYIVQYVEHLLDEKIAYLESANTISIYGTYKYTLIHTLPKKIYDIYEKRIRFVEISGKNSKINYLMFLLILTMYNGQISESLAREFDSDNSKVSFLIERRFIQKNHKNYIFEHESIMIFLKEMIMNDCVLRKKLGKEMLSHKDVVSDYPRYTLARLYLWTNQKDLALKEYFPIIETVKKGTNLSNVSIDASIYEYIDDVLDIISNDNAYEDVAHQLLKIKIYISLHHYIPINAVRDCNRCLEYISKSPYLKDNKVLVNSICAQKAHALLNSGMNFEGMLMLNELQVKMMVDKSGFDQDNGFEIIDRLCAIYIKFNCFSIAKEYSDLEVKIAMEDNDASLAAIAYRTRSKLYYLQDSVLCAESLDMVDKYLQKSPSKRIALNNRIYRNIANLSYVDLKKNDSSVQDTEIISNEAKENNLHRTFIQSELLLAAMYLKRGEKNDLFSAEAKAKSALDYSIRFGIPSYLWQIYNIAAIIDLRLGKSINVIKQQFNSAFNILRAQNMLFIGKRDLCYSNILAISNIAYFIRHNYTQDFFNDRMSAISYFNEGNSNKEPVTMTKQTALEKENLDHLYKITNSQFPELLFCSSPKIPLLKDNETGYFIALT